MDKTKAANRGVSTIGGFRMGKVVLTATLLRTTYNSRGNGGSSHKAAPVTNR